MITSTPSGTFPPVQEQNLERGEVQYFPVCPFALPQGDDRVFLGEQRLASRHHEYISYDPATGQVMGCASTSPEHQARLHHLLAGFSREVTAWLQTALPAYAPGLHPDRATLRTEEEATRLLGHSARKDLLHLDSFPDRPTWGRRILRVYANFNATEPRVWVTSDPFRDLLARYGKCVGLPGQRGNGWIRQLGKNMLTLFNPSHSRRSTYDEFMLRFAHFLRSEDHFQERGSKQLWNFAAGSAWVAFTDGCSHAVLRGRLALEHSFFVSPEVLTLPQESPAALLSQASGGSVLERAA